MATITHTLSLSIPGAASHDWWTPLIPAVGSALSAFVAAGAIIVSVVQNKRLEKIAQRNADIAADKLQIEMFDRRYNAWNSFADAATNYAIMIVNLTREQFDGGLIHSAPLIALTAATNQFYFVFDQEAFESALQVHDCLKGMIRARRPFITDQIGSPTYQPAMDRWLEADAEYNRAWEDLRALVKAKSQLALAAQL